MPLLPVADRTGVRRCNPGVAADVGGNASITETLIEPEGRFKVIAVGDVGHLPPSMLAGATGDNERSLAIPRLPVD